MNQDIEQLLIEAKLRYTKEADPESGLRFYVPFDTPHGPVRLNICAYEDRLVASDILRSWDQLPLPAPRELYCDLLRLNADLGLGRVFIWRDPDDQTDWIGVVGELPLGSLTPERINLLLGEVVVLAHRVLQLIAERTEHPQRVPG
jgi:hypothetical protein